MKIETWEVLVSLRMTEFSFRITELFLVVCDINVGNFFCDIPLVIFSPSTPPPPLFEDVPWINSVIYLSNRVGPLTGISVFRSFSRFRLAGCFYDSSPNCESIELPLSNPTFMPVLFFSTLSDCWAPLIFGNPRFFIDDFFYNWWLGEIDEPILAVELIF